VAGPAGQNLLLTARLARKWQGPALRLKPSHDAPRRQGATRWPLWLLVQLGVTQLALTLAARTYPLIPSS
jgi:hypothetical protein